MEILAIKRNIESAFKSKRFATSEVKSRIVMFWRGYITGLYENRLIFKSEYEEINELIQNCYKIVIGGNDENRRSY